MLSCPRCCTGNLEEGRSISMHLTRYCTGSILLFHAQRGKLTKKRSHELMLSGSCPSTYQQQIRNFNSLIVNVSVPMMNILHGMPSLSHLSWTQSELRNCNAHYSGFATDLSTPASVDDQINTNDDSVTDPVIEKCFFQRYTFILHFKFICCHKWIHTKEMILTCLMKSFDVSRHRPSIITWITQCCRYCQESNLYSCSQNTISWIFASQHYIQCPLQMDLLLLFQYLMSKPFWLHFLLIPWECARRTLHPIMISLQERWNCQNQLLMKYILDHFGSRLDNDTVVMIQMHIP